MKLAAWSLAFVLGLGAALGLDFAAGRTVSWQAFAVLTGASALLCAGLALRGGRSAMLFAPLGLLFFAGATLGGHALTGREAMRPAGVPATMNMLAFEAVLLSDPAPALDNSRLRVLVDAVEAVGVRTPAHFEADVFASRLTAPTGSGRAVDAFQYGDRYLITGYFRSVVDAEGIYAGVIVAREVALTGQSEGNGARRAVSGLRSRVYASIRRAVSGDAGGLAAAMVVGDRRGLSPEVAQDFRDAGTAHLLAISGMNITLVGGLAMAVGAWLMGRRKQVYLLVPLAAVWGYGALAGFSPSVIRAAVMFTVYLAAVALGRQRSALPAVGLAAAMMVAVDPEVLGSISFQLSFAAVAGIAVLSPGMASAGRNMLMRLTGSKEPPTGLVDALIAGTATGLGATAATAPLFLLHFGALSVWGVVSTLAALPALPFLTVLAALVGLTGLAWAGAAQVIGWPTWLTGEYINQVSHLFAWLPPGQFEAGRWATPISLALYGCVITWLARRWLAGLARQAWALLDRVGPGPVSGATGTQKVPLWLRRSAPAWLTGLALIVAATAWLGACTARPDGSLRVTFLETDRGDAIFIQTPNGAQALIDGGRSATGAAEAISGRLPFWERTLDLVLLTHGDQDHVGGLAAVLERFSVDVVADTPPPGQGAGPQDGEAAAGAISGTTRVYADWLRRADAHPGRRMTLTGGEVFALDDGVSLEVLSAGPLYPGAPGNDASVVTLLRYGAVTVLLTGDISCTGEAWLLASGADLKATALKVAHHGSRYSSCEPFLEAASPAVAIIQAEPDNPYGHPHEDALGRLHAVMDGDRVLVTGSRGDVTLVTDGTRLWVETER